MINKFNLCLSFSIFQAEHFNIILLQHIKTKFDEL